MVLFKCWSRVEIGIVYDECKNEKGQKIHSHSNVGIVEDMSVHASLNQCDASGRPILPKYIRDSSLGIVPTYKIRAYGTRVPQSLVCW